MFASFITLQAIPAELFATKNITSKKEKKAKTSKKQPKTQPKKTKTLIKKNKCSCCSQGNLRVSTFAKEIEPEL